MELFRYAIKLMLYSNNVHISKCWHFQIVTIKYFTLFSKFISNNTDTFRVTAKQYSKIRLSEDFVQTIVTFLGGKPNNIIFISHLGLSTGIIAHGAFSHQTFSRSVKLETNTLSKTIQAFLERTTGVNFIQNK